MARTKEFDPDKALKIAVNVFWRLGYEHTSLETLMREMGISKQSLYDTFGDKQSIYFRAMSRYRDDTNASLRKLFAREKSVRKGFAKIFQAMIRENKAQHERGCLLMNTNLSRAVADVEVREFLRDNQKQVEEIFIAAFVDAQERCEIGADKVERLVVMDAPIPGIEPWSEILQNPGVWHFNFHGPDAERLVQGRERIYFDRIWNDFTADPGKPDEVTRNFFTATYAQPGGMRAGFAQFTAFSQDAKDNQLFEQTKL